MKRILHLSCTTAARKLASIIQQVISTMMYFRSQDFSSSRGNASTHPQEGGNNGNYHPSSTIRSLKEASDVGELPSNLGRRGKPCSKTTPHRLNPLLLGSQVNYKGGQLYRGAVRLACSEDVLAEHSDSIHEPLRLKHPPPHADSSINNLEQASPLPFPIDADLIMKAIVSFPNGSGGGPDGLLPQYLKDLTGPSAGEGSVLLLKSLVGIITLILEGRIPKSICPLLGATLIPLRKKSGGIRPIAIGSTIGRRASKCAVLHALNLTLSHTCCPPPPSVGFWSPRWDRGCCSECL